VTDIEIRNYSLDNLHKMLMDAPENGFTVVVLPAGSEVHASYARNALNYEDMFIKPVIGWVSGVHIDDLNKVKPTVFNGASGAVSDNEVVALHAQLPDSLMAQIGTVNLFTQSQGDTILFEETGFQACDCLVNGQKENFADYLSRNGFDTRLPLVANYFGAMINVSFQKVDTEQHMVDFYAPVFEGIEYKLAEPVPDYLSSFQSALPSGLANVAFSCNCILNFLYSELEGKKIGSLFGPITFGEVAYLLLNQTLVYLTLENR